MTQRQQDITRRVVIDLKKVEGLIPRNSQGDPAFSYLGNESNSPRDNNSVLTVFTPEQIVALVNRALYQMEYSRKIHRERSQAQRDAEKPVKEAFKRLFPTTSWAQATEEQLKAAVQEVYKPKGEQL
jgi:hypothetical protein